MLFRSQGTTGIQGTQGIQGETGSQGAIGAQGLTGLQGLTGTQGIQGLTGTGTQGTQGTQGLTGGGLWTESTTAPVSPTLGDRWFNTNTGLEYTWIQDADGYQWVDTRTSGYIGTQGVQGIQGVNGSNGTQGTQGITGAGTQGIQGIQGILGLQGIQGTTSSSGGMTLLASGSLSGASIDISGISGSYINLELYIRNFRPATDGAALNGRINSDTSSIYGNRTGVAEADNSFSNTSWNNLSYNQDNGSTPNSSLMRLTFIDYANTTTLKVVELYSVTNNETTTSNINYTTGIAIVRTTSAVSSIQLFCSTGNFTSGNYYLYGVK
mgnify:CR=1 FL=1